MNPNANQMPEDRPSSAAAEQIEDMVKQALIQHPDLANTIFDFGQSTDDALEFWVNDTRYGSADDIPDVRIREAIAEAVKNFSQ